jgi:hypothetical protein
MFAQLQGEDIQAPGIGYTVLVVDDEFKSGRAH